MQTEETVFGGVNLPMLAIVGSLVGFVCALVVAFKPNLARIISPIYAICQGFFLGAISKAYNTEWDGIVIQAVGATLGVFAVMLVLYRTNIIKVTDKFRRTIIMATLGLMAFYFVSWILSLFGVEIGIFSSTSWMGIAFSLFAAGLAAMNLALDFDFIEKGSKAGLPKQMEWFAAFGLLVTLVASGPGSEAAQVGEERGVERLGRFLLHLVPGTGDDRVAAEVRQQALHALDASRVHQVHPVELAGDEVAGHADAVGGQILQDLVVRIEVAIPADRAEEPRVGELVDVRLQVVVGEPWPFGT